MREWDRKDRRRNERQQDRIDIPFTLKSMSGAALALVMELRGDFPSTVGCSNGSSSTSKSRPKSIGVLKSTAEPERLFTS